MPYTYDYPRGALAVDCVVFGLDDDDLKVLLIQRAQPPFEGKWALPGGFVNLDETLEEAARRELEEETGLSALFLEQLYAFSAVDRDPRERVVSVAHYALVNLPNHHVHAATDARDAAWFAVDDVPGLAFDHADILQMALERLRGKLRSQPIDVGLLPGKFTLAERPARPPADDFRGGGPSKRSEQRHESAVGEDMMPSTVQFHRVLRATPERVYRAFLDPDAMVKWLPPNGFTGKVHHMDPRVGGTYKMSFTNFTSGNSHSFGGAYLELVPHERLRWTDKLDGLPGEMTVTVALKKVSVGTDVHIVQEGIPDAIPPEACNLGWQESLTLLAKLVEAEIPD